MGTKVNAQVNENSDYVQSVKQETKVIMERTISPTQILDLLYPLSKNYYLEKKALKILHGQTESVIRQRRSELAKKIQNNNDNELVKTKKPFLDILLGATIQGEPLNDKDIREEVDTFMFEGHDTTTSAISFALFCLANNAAVQKRVFEEQQAIFEDQEDLNVSYENLQNMKFLENVIKEALRLYPSVPLYGRVITEEFQYDGKRWPQGWTIMVWAYGVQRNSKYFEKPDEFNPDRFDNVDGKLPYAYIPFSAGPRNCIGQKFAMLEMKSVISKIVRTFELKPAFPEHKLVLSCEVTLKSANGIKLSLHKRS